MLSSTQRATQTNLLQLVQGKHERLRCELTAKVTEAMVERGVGGLLHSAAPLGFVGELRVRVGVIFRGTSLRGRRDFLAVGSDCLCSLAFLYPPEDRGDRKKGERD